MRSGSASSGATSRTARNSDGRAPQTARSLALTVTASRPASFVVKETGSLAIAHSSPPILTSAASSPAPGPSTTSGGSLRATTSATSSHGTLPCRSRWIMSTP